MTTATVVNLNSGASSGAFSSLSSNPLYQIGYNPTQMINDIVQNGQSGTSPALQLFSQVSNSLLQSFAQNTKAAYGFSSQAQQQANSTFIPLDQNLQNNITQVGMAYANAQQTAANNSGGGGKLL